MSAETIKMPEPIMEPMTRVVALVRPRPWTKSVAGLPSAEEVGTDGGVSRTWLNESSAE
jgi:hypothetical protein